MKRFAVMALLAGFLWSGNSLPAADPVPLPPPTGMAPTVPQVPVPVLSDGLPIPAADGPRTRVLDRFGCGVGRKAGCDGDRCCSRLFGRLMGVSLFKTTEVGSEPYDSYPGKPRWCSDCAPAVRKPLPPLPANVWGGTWDHAGGAGRVSDGGACSTGTCAAGSGGHGVGHCWQKFTGWLCYRQTPFHMPATPNPRMPPTYTYFPCHDRAGYGTGGCGNAGCRAGGAVGPVGLANPGGFAGRGAGGNCKPCPPAGEAVMPGYRLAAPETPVADGQPASADVVTSSYRAPAPAPASLKAGGPPSPWAKPTVRPFPQP
ncbi:MAG: hypothetical protein JWO38_5663 [Gemmataceae bacterium]|nr:hypothetical protein [Gemmataceae bacterium]